jgi:hypothetical protein
MNDNDTLADDLRKDSLALMKLLADEKHKSEALEAELAGVRSDLAMCGAKGSSLQMRTDKADLLRVLGVADERIKALEAEVAEARRCLDGGTDCMDDKRKLRAALREAETTLLIYKSLPKDRWPGPPTSALESIRSALETACECMPLDARGTPGDLEIYCPKCGKIFRGSETDQMCIHGVHVREICAECRPICAGSTSGEQNDNW